MALSRWRGIRVNDAMTRTKSLYHGHRFPATVISHAVRWYFRFQLSLRDI
jgi:putative transposase